MKKKRLLFCGEASWLATGFAKFNREVIKRLNALGKYEIAEMGNYGRQDAPQAATLPWRFYGVLPLNSEEERIYNSNPINQFGAYKFDAVVADFQPDIVCVPPGELVHTKHGTIPIEDVKVGDLVLTHKGRYRPVIKTMRRQHVGDIYRIYVNGMCKPLVVTGEHPVLIYRKRKQTNKKKSYLKIYDGVIPEFVPAKDVKAGDLVLLAPKINGNSYSNVRVSDYLTQFVECGVNKIKPAHYAGTPINNNVIFNEDFAALCGYLIGDGCIHDNSISISFNATESRFAEHCVRIIKAIFDLDSYYTKCTDREMLVVQINSVLLAEFFEKYFGRRLTKRFPAEIWDSPASVRKAALLGLVRSDGCYSNKEVTFNNNRYDMILDARLLSASVGIPVNTNKTGGKNKSYNMAAFGSSTEPMSVITDKHNGAVVDRKIGNGRRCRKTHIINGNWTASVKRIRKEPYIGQVYNLEVEKDNSYHVMGFCVHNCSMLDPWMMPHLVRSRFRGNYKVLLTPTVDSAPQKQEWVDEIFSKADAISTYSRFGRRTLNAQGLKVSAVTSPGVDLDVFKPMDKISLRNDWGLNKSLFIFGTVMRNQKRKLFSDLFEAFSLLRKRYSGTKEIEHSVLLCHTSYPDVGWDIPELLRRTSLNRHVIFTYKCDACTKTFFSWFLPCNQAGLGQCIFCGQVAAHMPNTHNSVSESELAEIYNLMDVYCQVAICEGWGVPVVEAKACGLPVLCSNYSALEDHVENGGALPIDIDRRYTEAETMAIRTFSDVDCLAGLMKKMISNKKERLELGKNARECAEKMHTWDAVAKTYDRIIDEIQILERKDSWEKLPEFKLIPPYTIDKNLPNEQFVTLCYKAILMREPDPQGFNHWMSSLAKGMAKEDVENYFRGELEAHNKFESIRFSRAMQMAGYENNPIKISSNILAGPVI